MPPKKKKFERKKNCEGNYRIFWNNQRYSIFQNGKLFDRHVLKLAPYYGILLLLLSTGLSTMVARTLPIWYDPQHQPSTITSLVGIWGNTNLVPVFFICSKFLPFCEKYFSMNVLLQIPFFKKRKSSRNHKIWNFTKNDHNCLQHESMLQIFLKFSYFEYCQTWLNTLLDDQHFSNITKLE